MIPESPGFNHGEYVNKELHRREECIQVDLLKGLNDKQIEAVMAPYKPVLVLSGSGSGKTLVLTRRIAKMIRDGIDPGSILAVTFTNKAAKEMKKRIFLLIVIYLIKNLLIEQRKVMLT